ncbi:glutathione S-transferase N-terminal domain-containing protein [soil metagenome]
MITVYGMGSPNAIKVLIMLAEIGLDYQFERVDVVGGEQFGDAFKALNPNSKVPVLVDARGKGDPIVIFESGAILLYLAETSGILWPIDLAQRYRVLSWLMWQMGGVGPMGGQAIHFNHTHPEPGYAQTRFTIEINRLTDVLEGELSQRAFIAGPDYSLADIALYPWYRTFSRFLPTLVERPAIANWIERISARPAVREVEERMLALSRQDMSAIRHAEPAALDRYFGRIAAEK